LGGIGFEKHNRSDDYKTPEPTEANPERAYAYFSRLAREHWDQWRFAVGDKNTILSLFTFGAFYYRNGYNIVVDLQQLYNQKAAGYSTVKQVVKKFNLEERKELEKYCNEFNPPNI
jgi:hypothetical protein